MAEPVHSIPWYQDGWIEAAQDWVHARLKDCGLRLSAAMDPFHIRPWSCVMRVPTETGVLYFKASASLLAFEPALSAYIAQTHPQISPEILAVDSNQGWMLMRDSGTPLRVFIRAEKSVARWQAILPRFAWLQRDLAGHAAELLALGLPDRRLELLPGLFDNLVADHETLLVDHPDSLSAGEYERLQAGREHFARLCTELGSYPIPASLHHDDFHDGNLFLQGERVIFTDWAESALTYPFFSLVVLLRGAENSLDLAPDAPELENLRSWYLSAWTDLLPLAELRHAARLAEQIGLVNRALTWHQVVSSLPLELRGEYSLAAPSYLQDYLSSLGSEK